MSTYDQWKTASPYDDDFDCLEVCESFLEKHKRVSGPKGGLIALLRKATGDKVERSLLDESLDLIEGLLDYIDENI